jgi:predicted aspartyl protease
LRQVWSSLLFILALALLTPQVSVAGQPTGGTLDDYLKRLGYEPVSLNARRQYNQPTIEAKLANKKFSFLIDTGWGITTLKEGVGGPFKSLAPMGVSVDSAKGKPANLPLVLVETLTIGSFDFTNQPARVGKLETDFVSFPYDGVLGCDFLARNWCLVDCGRHFLYVRAGASSDEQSEALAETLRRSGFAEVPLQRDSWLTATGQANGQPIRLVVDTGSAFTVLDDSQLKRLGLATVKEEAPATGTAIRQDLSGNLVGIGKVGMHQVRVATLESLQIGPRHWKHIHVGISSLKHWGLASTGGPGETIEGLLGPDVLNAHGALIDVSHRKLWLYPEK